MIPRSLAGMFAGCLCLSACGGGGTAGDDADVFAAPAEKVTPTPDTASRGQSSVAFALRSDGITVEEQGPGPRDAIPLRFGDSEANVVAAISTILGRPRGGAGQECGGGPVVSTDFGSIQINLRDEKFVGYVATMAEGAAFIGPGDSDLSAATLSQLRNRGGAQRVESTLEHEIRFRGADGESLGGFVESTADEAPLLSVFAGVTCFYR